MNEKNFDAHNMSIPEYINFLYSTTNDINVIGICREDYEEIKNNYWAIEYFVMNWTEKDIPDLICVCEKLINDIKKIADLSEKHGDDFIYLLRENTELYSVWEKYIQTLDENEETTLKITDISERIDCDEIAEDELKFYEEIIAKRIEVANQRIGNSVYNYDAIVRSQRLCKLFLLKAPEIVIKNEARLLAEAVAINRFCVEEIKAD